MRRFRNCWFISLLLTQGAWAQIAFDYVQHQGQEGLFPNTPRSMAWGDFTNDGYPDIVLSGSNNGGEKTIAVLVNEAGRRFVHRDVLPPSALQARSKSGGATWADLDNDGDLDLFLPTGFSFTFDQQAANVLLRNDDGFFVDITTQSGLVDEQISDNALWFDYDLDGFLDLYIGNPGGAAARNLLYRNQGDGTFLDITVAAGLDIQLQPDLGGSNGGMGAADFDGNGWPDLYIGVWGANNRLFLGHADGVFTDNTSGEIEHWESQAFGATLGDINNDGLIDIFQTGGGGAGESFQLERSNLLLNQGGGRFLDITEAAGLAVLRAQSLQGVHLADFDNDGDLDLVAGNLQRPFLFLNEGGGTFSDASAQSGLGEKAINPAVADYNLDGFLDIWFSISWPFAQTWGLYRNKANGNHWLRVELVGTESNRQGVGGQVIARSGALRQTRLVPGGDGYNQSEQVVHLGVGGSAQVDSLIIEWPSGRTDILVGIAADQRIRVVEGSGQYFPVEAASWQHDLPDFIDQGQNLEVAIQVDPALFLEGASIETVTADLSGLGGAANVELAAAGDGTYTLARRLTVAGQGYRQLAINIEQNTPQGRQWSQFSKRIFIDEPGPVADDLSLLADAENAQWTNIGWPLEPISEPVFQGQKSFMATTDQDVLFVDFWRPDPEPPIFYDRLHFAFHPGDATAVEGPVTDVGIFLVGANGTGAIYFQPIDLDQRRWHSLEFPLPPAVFYALGGLREVIVIAFVNGTVYFDDMYLAAGQRSTAVSRADQGEEPGAFALAQNYPNPFNAETLIPFSTVADGQVELAVFNAAGQQVATLASGARPQGRHALGWDGRNDAGLALASGVYFYQLRAGNRVETRKLLLLR